MRLVRIQMLIFFVSFAMTFTALVRLNHVNAQVATNDLDRSVKPGDDFYRHANGMWLKSAAIPAGQSSFDTRAILTERNSQRVRDLIREAAESHAAKGSVNQKVGDYFASFVDQAEIDARGLQPIAADLTAITSISDKKSLAAYLGSTLNIESDGLIANGDHVFGLWVSQSFQDSKRNYVHLWQGGLGLPDRDNYLDASAEMAESRAKYKKHIAAMLKLAGIRDPETKAANVLALETRIAQSFAPDSDAADVFKQNNPWKLQEFSVRAPGLDWNGYFQAAGLADQSEIIVWQPTAVTGVAALAEKEDLEHWKDYLTFHLIEHFAPVLPRAIAAERSSFEGSAPDRSKAAIAATNGALGQAVGQLYVQRYFPPAAKAEARAMAQNLITAYRNRIPKLTWMSAATKQKALAKLETFTIGVGYPDKWIDFASLEIVRGDALGNMRRAEAFYRQRSLAQLKEPADPAEWRMDPQTVGAIIMFSPNSEFFSAGILQPPYFDPQGDAASNYGSAGAGMAHEISHSFDELGNIYDAEGRLDHWWTDEDLSLYKAAADKLARQFSAYCPVADLCVNGKQVLGESISDLAGLEIAHDAYILSLNGKSDTVIDGLTGEQRFFLAYAQRWRKLQSDAALRKQVKTDTHAPGEYRADAVRNLEAWYKAFKVTPSEKLYLKPEERIEIW